MRVNVPLLALVTTLSASAEEEAPDPLGASRPTPVEIKLSPAGTDLAVRIKFDRPPSSAACGRHCANATIFIDTDSDPETGMAGQSDHPETGADVAITLSGARRYGESDEPYLKATVRQLSRSTRDPQKGEVLAVFEQQTEPDRLQINGLEVQVLVDVSNVTIPSGKTARAVFLRPEGAPVIFTGPGMVTEDSGKVEVVKQPLSHKKGYREDDLTAKPKKKKSK